MKSVNIYARGGLGNLIIEYLYGIAVAIEYNLNYELFLSTHRQVDPNVNHHNTLTEIDRVIKFRNKINNDNGWKKLPYWIPKYTDIYFKNFKTVWDQHAKLLLEERKVSDYAAIHVRGTDKLRDKKNEAKLYDELFYRAKCTNLDIKIATDDTKLTMYLCKRHAIKYEHIARSVYEDWRTLFEATHIFSIYSTFSYSILLLKPNTRYTVASYENSVNSYEYVKNEFEVLCQLQKYCKNLEILNDEHVIQSSEELNSSDELEISYKKAYAPCKLLNRKEKSEILNLLKVDSDISSSAEDLCKLIAGNGKYISKYSRRKQKELLQYFTSNNKILDQQLIDVPCIERGLYQTRQILSHQIHTKEKSRTREKLGSLKNNKKINSFSKVLDQIGVLKIPNIFNADIHKTILSEMRNYDQQNYGSLSKNSGSMIISKHYNGTCIQSLFLSQGFSELISYLTGYPYEIAKLLLKQSMFLQKVEVAKKKHDVQTTLHSDTFFPAFKFWYFPFEVKENDSPFSYCLKSQLLTADRLKFDFQNARDSILGKNKAISEDHNEGSFRSTDIEIMQLGTERQQICNDANTLVVANVFGYHARSVATQPASRLAIHGSLRYQDPFFLK